MNSKRKIANIMRGLCWAFFLLFNFISWGMPLGAVYLPEESGFLRLIDQFFALLIFTGFLVVVAFEYLRKSYVLSSKENASALFIFFTLVLPFSYYVLGVFSAHSEKLFAELFFLAWFSIVGVFGYLIRGMKPNKNILYFTLIFCGIGVFIYCITTISWSYIYGSYIMRSSHLSLTPYIMGVGSVVVWVLLLFSVVLLGRRYHDIRP
jgi:hypothetical protein